MKTPFRSVGPLAVSLCALAGSSGAAILSLDNGTAEDAIGLTTGGTILVFNGFSGTGIVTDVRIDWGNVANGTAFDIGIWSDPDLDGNPSDAVLLQSLNGQLVANANPAFPHAGLYNIYDIIDTAVTGSFFVGFAINHASGENPASIDTTASQGKSWASIGDFSSIATAGTIDSFGFPGNWLIQVSVVPEPSSTLLVAGGVAWFVARRRRPAA